MKQMLTKEEKKVMRKVQLRSHQCFLAGNMLNMQANGVTWSMIPVIEQIYKDDPKGRMEAYERTQQFMNTHSIPFCFIIGLNWAMEKEHHEHGTIDGKTIESVKAALMGPSAGMFDSLFFNCIRVIAASIGIGFSMQGNLLGVLLFFAIYALPQSVLKFTFVKYGYIYGTAFIDKVFHSGLMSSFTKAASILGLVMVGAMTAQMVNVPVSMEIAMGETSLVINDVINQIFPGLLSVLLLFTFTFLIRKGTRPTRLVIATLLLGLIGAFVGVF